MFTEKRTFIAVIGYDEEVANKYCERNGIDGDTTPGDFLEQEFGWLEESGFSLERWALVDEDVQWEAYLQYLVQWATDHNNPEEYEGQSPLNYEDWKKSE